MNDDIIRIRREKWIQHQKQAQLNNNDDNNGNNHSSNDNNHDPKGIESKDTGPFAASKVIDLWDDSENDDNDDDDDGIEIKCKSRHKKNEVVVLNDNTPPTASNLVDLWDDSDTDDDNDDVQRKRKAAKQNDDDDSCIDLTVDNNNNNNSPRKKSPASNTVARSNNAGSQRRKNNIDTSAITSNPYKNKKRPAIQSSSSFTFSIATWNVWFVMDAHPRQRMARIAQLLLLLEEKKKKPTFIGLQEVTPELYSYLAPPLQDAGYELQYQPGGVAYGCALGVLLKTQEVTTIEEFGFEPYRNTIMSRGLLWVKASMKTTGCSILFGTTHLESYLNPANNGSTNRQKQLQQIDEFRKTMMQKNTSIQGMIVTGDLNWDDERKRKTATGTDPKLLSIINKNNNNSSSCCWQDAWLVNRPGQDGYTYDSKENPMLRGNLRRRFDRCLTYFPSGGQNNNFGVHATELMGKEEVPGGLTWEKEIQPWGQPNAPVAYQTRPLAPSDHFGLLVTVGDASQIPPPPTTAAAAPKKRKYRKKK